MGIYTTNASIKPMSTLAIFKRDHIFLVSFVLCLNIFVNFKTIQYYKTFNLLFYTLLSSGTLLRFTK